MRAEYAYGDNGNMTGGPYNGNLNNATTSNSTFRARGYIHGARLHRGRAKHQRRSRSLISIPDDLVRGQLPGV